MRRGQIVSSGPPRRGTRTDGSNRPVCEAPGNVDGTHDYSTMRTLQPPPLASHIPPAPPPPPASTRSSSFSRSSSSHTTARWETHPVLQPLSTELTEDALRAVLSHTDAVSTLQSCCKPVSKAWRAGAREVLCDVSWLLSSGVSLHTLLKSGQPSPQLAVKLAMARPEFLHERADDGLLPLQYAAAYVSRSQPELVASLRTLTKGFVPGGLPVLHKAAFAFRRARLRAVQTNIHHAPVAG